MKKRKKGRGRRIVLLILLLLILAAVIWFVVLPKFNQAVTDTYDTYTTRIGSISNSLSFSGSMSVKNSETLTADKAGTVRKIYVSEAESVKKDQRLIRLSTGEIIKASFDGQVNEISVEEEDDVSANENLIQIVDFSQMTVALRVDEYSITKIELGQPCVITLTALGISFPSTISHINRISTTSGNTTYYTVSCDVEVTEQVLPGMQVTVTIPLEEATDAVILNKNALSFAGDNSAYVLKQNANGEMERVAVTVGVDNDNYVEIREGLGEGETVYKQTTAKQNTNTGLFSGFQMMNQNTSTQRNNSNQRNNNGGGNFNGGTRNNGGNMPGRP